jgi:hypothetical protein
MLKNVGGEAPAYRMTFTDDESPLQLLSSTLYFWLSKVNFSSLVNIRYRFNDVVPYFQSATPEFPRVPKTG